MKIKIYFFCSWIFVSLSSCYGPIKLQHSLNEYSESLGYTFDTTIDTLNRNQKVYLKILDNINLSDSTKVKEDGMFVLPLVIAGGFKYDMTVTLGKKSVNPSFSQFIYESFQTESKRSGCFEIAGRKSHANYTLEIVLEDCEISAKYHKDTFGYGHSYKHNWILKPITGTFKIESRLFKKNNLLFCNTYSSTRTSQPKTLRFNSENEMNKQLMENFAKTASLEIKEKIESVILDINKQCNQD